MFRSALSCTVITALLLSAAIFLASCGSTSSNMSSSSPATVNVALSDPATCSAPQGPFSHIYVTITDVQINASSSAGDNDPGWLDLTPTLQQNPQQVDLLGQANNQCFLAMLGSTTELQPGTYQQIRIVLANNSATVNGNLCGGTSNCVMLTADQTGAPQPLLLSGESQTGIKIPSGQIAGGQFTVTAGQTEDLDIDFDACASIVTLGNGQFRLKPVLHAGEVNLTSSSINGKIVDSVTGQPIGGNTVVALEQKDNAGVDRVIMETVTDSTGAFVFCPVTAGTYDLVAAAVNGTGAAYAATIIAGVQPGNALGTVPLVAQAGTNQSPASITGQVTSSTGSAPIAVDISVSALQSAAVNSVTLLVTIPLAAQSAAAANLTTAPAGSCPANTDCVSYTLSVPAANPSVGSFSTSGTQNPAAPAGGPVNYTVDARAFVPGGPPDCTPSDLQTSSTVTNAALAVTAGSSVTAATLAFSGCQ